MSHGAPDQYHLFGFHGAVVFPALCDAHRHHPHGAHGHPPLALTGAVFGAALSGILYRASGGRILAAVLGEVIGTGLIGAVVSYPVMELLYGRTGLSWMYYVPLFISGTLIGGSIAFALLTVLSRNGTLREFQRKLGIQVYDRRA